MAGGKKRPGGFLVFLFGVYELDAFVWCFVLERECHGHWLDQCPALLLENGIVLQGS